MNSEGHYLVVISVAKCSDRHCNFPHISLPGSDLHCSFFTVYKLLVLCNQPIDNFSNSYVVFVPT